MLRAKRAEMGIGTLIIFIALLLVAAIAAGVLIQTSGSLQEKALTTGDQAKGQISTNAKTIEVSATNGMDGTVRHFNQIMKLAPGSESIKLAQTIFTINTYDESTTLTYAGNDAITYNEAGGYYTLTPVNVTGLNTSENKTLTDDYDDDERTDNVTGGLNGNNVTLELSNSSESLPIGYCNTGTFVSTMNERTREYLTPETTGDCVNDTSNNTSWVKLYPKEEDSGVYAVEYLQTGSNHVEGNLQRGDVIKLYYEAPKDIGEDEYVRLNFIPKMGTPTLTEFITPEVISEERIYLYP